MKNPNLKIPLVLINNGLPILVILVYSELNGLYSKNNQCYITDKELSRRLNRSISSIQRAMHELRNYDLIQTKQKSNYKGRFITVTPVDMNKFLLIPVKVIRNKDLSLGALLVYGSLYSRYKKKVKEYADKHKEDAPLIISVTNQEIANELGKTARFIRKKIKELAQKNYIAINSIKGVGIEISLLTTEKVGTKCVSTYEQNEHPHRNKMRIHIGTKRATNKYLIDNINKGDDLSSSSSNKDHPRAVDHFDPFEVGEPLKEPVYYDSIPTVNDMPPLQENESSKDITELNQLDSYSTQQVNDTRTANSGSGGETKSKDQKQDYHSSQQVNATETGNKPSRDASKEHHPDPKSQENKYEAYNGFNLEYQVNQLRNILDAKTGKHYVINAYQKPLIKQQLDNDYSLNDFAKVIDYLIQHKEAISVKDLATNLPNYLSKINSN